MHITPPRVGTQVRHDVHHSPPCRRPHRYRVAVGRLGRAETARVTFILVNDIYLMADSMMPDGKRRGGFARLAAVVKAERARARATGGHVIFAHGGDTLSPSLMSGIDGGAHIIDAHQSGCRRTFSRPATTSSISARRIFLQRMAEAKFPLYAANLRGPDGQPLPNFKDRSIVTVDGVRIGLTGATYDETPARLQPGGSATSCRRSRPRQQQAEALRREGADFVVAVAHASRAAGLRDFRQPHGRSAAQRPRPRSLHQLRRPRRHGRIQLRCAIRHRDRCHHRREGSRTGVASRAGGRSSASSIPRRSHPIRRWRRVVAEFEQELSKELDVRASAPLRSSSTAARRRCARARPPSAIWLPMQCGHPAHADAAVTNGGGIRGGKIYRARSDHHAARHSRRAAVRQPLVTVDISGASSSARSRTGLSQLPGPSGRFPQVSGLTIEADMRPPGRQSHRVDQGWRCAARRAVRPIGSRPTISCCAAATAMAAFRDAKPLLPPDDSPLLANEVMVHVTAARHHPHRDRGPHRVEVKRTIYSFTAPVIAET